MRFVLPFALAALAAMSACAPKDVPPIASAENIEAYCAPKEARATSMASILASVADRIDDPYPRLPEIRRELKAVQGAIGHWDDQLFLAPNLAKQFGETGQYIRVEALAVSTAPVLPDGDTTIPTRRVYLQVKDHDVLRWIGATAYDVQNVCVEGTRQQ